MGLTLNLTLTLAHLGGEEVDQAKRYITVTLPLHYRYITVTLQLHYRYIMLPRCLPAHAPLPTAPCPEDPLLKIDKVPIHWVPAVPVADEPDRQVVQRGQTY